MWRRLQPICLCCPTGFAHASLIIILGVGVQNAADQPMLITSSTNVVVTGNVFDSVLCYPFTNGAADAFVPTPQPPIFVATSSNLYFSGNSYIVPANCTYGNFTSPIQTYGNTVTNITIV